MLTRQVAVGLGSATSVTLEQYRVLQLHCSCGVTRWWEWVSSPVFSRDTSYAQSTMDHRVKQRMSVWACGQEAHGMHRSRWVRETRVENSRRTGKRTVMVCVMYIYIMNNYTTNKKIKRNIWPLLSCHPQYGTPVITQTEKQMYHLF